MIPLAHGIKVVPVAQPVLSYTRDGPAVDCSRSLVSSKSSLDLEIGFKLKVGHFSLELPQFLHFEFTESRLELTRQRAPHAL